MWCTMSFCLFSNDREREREREGGPACVDVCLSVPLNNYLISLWTFLTVFEKRYHYMCLAHFLHFLIFTHNNSDCVG